MNLNNLIISRDSKKISKSNLSVFEKAEILKSKNAGNLFDVSNAKWNDIPKNIDIFTYSFPCQDISNQGLKKGMSKKSNTRSSLLWHISRLLKEMKNNLKKDEMPKYLLMENVRQVVSQNNINDFKKFISELDKTGYKSKYYILDSSNFSMAQKRIRCFCLSINKEYKEKINWKFPKKISSSKTRKKAIKNILEENYLENSWLPQLNKYKISSFKESKCGIRKAFLEKYSTAFKSESFVYDINYLGPTLTASGALSRIKIIDNNSIRKLSALECLKYMGFKKSDYLKMKKAGLNDQKITFLAGNSICIPVIEEIFKTMEF